MYFFTSDTHFGSDGTIKRESRPFASAQEMEEKVVKLWNEKANTEDIIFHLGDFINYNSTDNTSWKDALEIVRKINSKVVLIIGNNEERLIEHEFEDNFENFKNYCKKTGFLDVLEEKFIDFSEKRFYLNHFPRKHKDDYVNLFGHTHRATGLWKPFGFNVGCDLNYFNLYSEEDVLHLLKMKTLWWDGDTDTNCM